MNELQLSQDINVITAEINSYKQVAGQAIFEIGRRLKHVKENDLAYGEWGDWLEAIQMSRGQATKFITVYEELGADDSMWNKLGTQALYHIATLPQEDREKEHALSSGETKTVDEMTVRELQEVKKQLKQAESQAEQAKKSEEIALKQLEEMEDKEPEVIEKEVIKEVDKTDYERVEYLEEQIKMLGDRYEYLSKEDEKEKELKHLSYESNKSVLTLKLAIDEFLKDYAINAFRKGAIASASEQTRERLQEGVEEMKGFFSEIELALSGRIDLTKREAK